MQKLKLAEISKTCMNNQIYEPSDDSFALIDAIAQDFQLLKKLKPKFAVEIGSGSGYVICSVKLILNQLKIPCQCWATDISRHALNATNQTLKNHSLTNQVETIQTDLFSNFQFIRTKIDLLIFNPPYVPTPPEELSREDVGRAWAGGYMGRQIMDKIINDLDSILSQQGIFYLVTVLDNDPKDILQKINSQGKFIGQIVLERAADEERLSILRFVRIEVQQYLMKQ
eukprot:TRINITY_DN45019_c0_g1_i1.p1 TRINITY_DN45019_c0_g1~~TRINITY_DN45019_c0_g1_i1.p1  ORF type:complete len:227 (-),score=35.95 TRINITY_DN45019_c0_g1_i1:31-711(-)